MSDEIALLSEALINQIAAGEVIERPASVVKELVENALDAGATTIRITLEEGGMGRILIEDDGRGMSEDDAQRALLRHATSKLRDFDGLTRIRSMGFRGEAVPAVASVSRFELQTSQPGALSGTRIRVEGGGDPEVEPCEPVGGTLIRVEDLFFNVPARRKFLKRESTELKHAEEAVLRVALANPEVGFFLNHGEVSLLSSPACADDPTERIAAALGHQVHPHLLEVHERQLGISVRGHVASPEYTLPHARGIYTFVNRRFVRDRGLIHAVQKAFQESLPPGRQPVVVLFIEIDPREVDVNVHPQKLEVRFSDPGGVHEVVRNAVQHALQTAPWLQEAAALEGSPASGPAAAHYAMAVERFLTRARESGAEGEGPLPFPIAGERDEGLLAPAPAFGQAAPQLNEAPPPGWFGALTPIGTLADRFHLCEGPGGTLVVIDPHAARERVRLSAFHRAWAKGSPRTVQTSLFTSTITFSPDDARRIARHLESFSRLGFALEPFGGTTFSLTSLPEGIEALDAETVIREVSQALPPPDSPLTPVTLAEALRVMACHAAGGEALFPGAQALRALLAELDRADFNLPCRHGAVVVHQVPLLELVRRAR